MSGKQCKIGLNMASLGSIMDSFPLNIAILSVPQAIWLSNTNSFTLILVVLQHFSYISGKIAVLSSNHGLRMQYFQPWGWGTLFYPVLRHSWPLRFTMGFTRVSGPECSQYCSKCGRYCSKCGQNSQYCSKGFTRLHLQTRGPRACTSTASTASTCSGCTGRPGPFTPCRDLCIRGKTSQLTLFYLILL